MKKKAQKQQRLSMKLLWKLARTYAEMFRGTIPPEVVVFLEYVEEQMKPLKP